MFVLLVPHKFLQELLLRFYSCVLYLKCVSLSNRKIAFTLLQLCLALKMCVSLSYILIERLAGGHS